MQNIMRILRIVREYNEYFYEFLNFNILWYSCKIRSIRVIK
jgi:hypothetical protein